MKINIFIFCIIICYYNCKCNDEVSLDISKRDDTEFIKVSKKTRSFRLTIIYTPKPKVDIIKVSESNLDIWIKSDEIPKCVKIYASRVTNYNILAKIKFGNLLFAKRLYFVKHNGQWINIEQIIFKSIHWDIVTNKYDENKVILYKDNVTVNIASKLNTSAYNISIDIFYDVLEAKCKSNKHYTIKRIVHEDKLIYEADGDDSIVNIIYYYNSINKETIWLKFNTKNLKNEELYFQSINNNWIPSDNETFNTFYQELQSKKLQKPTQAIKEAHEDVVKDLRDTDDESSSDSINTSISSVDSD